jgi:hypothetical protein
MTAGSLQVTVYDAAVERRAEESRSLEPGADRVFGRP